MRMFNIQITACLALGFGMGVNFGFWQHNLNAGLFAGLIPTLLVYSRHVSD